MNNDFFTRKQLALRWGCTPQHISNLVREDKLPSPIPISERINLWRAEDIERLEKEKQRKNEEKLQPILRIGS